MNIPLNFFKKSYNQVMMKRLQQSLFPHSQSHLNQDFSSHTHACTHTHATYMSDLDGSVVIFGSGSMRHGYSYDMTGQSVLVWLILA